MSNIREEIFEILTDLPPVERTEATAQIIELFEKMVKEGKPKDVFANEVAHYAAVNALDQYEHNLLKAIKGLEK